MDCEICLDKKIQKYLEIYEADKKKLFLIYNNIKKEILDNVKMKDIKDFFTEIHNLIDKHLNENK